MKKLRAILLMLAVAALVFAACKSPAAGQTDTNGRDTAQTVQNQPHPSGLTLPWEKDPLNGAYISLQAEAVVTVAEAYYERGMWLQYDNKYSIGGSQLYRLSYRENSPEDLTGQHTGYTNCAYFVNDVFYQALGVDLGHLTTEAMVENAADMQVFSYTVTGRETDSRKLEIGQQFLDTLQQGDIIVCRHKDDGGHAMLYIGDGMMTESLYYGGRGGGDYDYDKNRDRIELGGSIDHREVMVFFDKDEYNYFWGEKSWTILRPLDKYKDVQPTQTTLNRINNLKNIVVEKISTHPTGKCADVGEEITYTFNIRNGGTENAVLDITDKLPEHTSFISGCDDKDGDTLRWSVTVPSGESVSISYTVKVDNDPALYDGGFIESDSALVGGVPVSVQTVFIGKHLNSAQENAISSADSQPTEYTERGTELANAIYKNAGIDISLADAEEILSQVFERKGVSQDFKLIKQGKYHEMVIPTLYGGRYVYTSSLYDRTRTRGVKAYQLYVGDIMIGEENGVIYAYMYAGTGRVIDLMSGKALSGAAKDDALISGWGMHRYVFIRPAAVYNDYE